MLAHLEFSTHNILSMLIQLASCNDIHFDVDVLDTCPINEYALAHHTPVPTVVVIQICFLYSQC